MLLNRIRRCIAHDDGVTVVETMFAIMVLTVALFGLMGTFIASAQSQLNQRQRTTATRLATEQLEKLRQQGHEALKVSLAGAYERTTSVPITGTPYTVTTRLQEVDAAHDALPDPPSVCPNPPTSSPPAGCPRHLRVTTINARVTVSWNVQGRTSSTVSRTAIAPTKPDDTRDILGFTFNPSAPYIGVDGRPTTNIVVHTQLKGFVNSPQTSVRLWYWDHEGKKGPLTMTYDTMITSGRWWKVSIDRLNVMRPLPEGVDVADLQVLIEVTDLSDGTVFSQTQTVQVVRPPPPPTILSQAQETDRFIVNVPGGTATSPITTYAREEKVKGTVVANQFHNRTEVKFSISVLGLTYDSITGEPIDQVHMAWRDGTGTLKGYAPQPLEPMTYNKINGRWERTFVVNQQSFQSGSAQPFYFQATRHDGVKSNLLTHTHPVVAS